MDETTKQINEDLREARKIHGVLTKYHAKIGTNLKDLYDCIDSIIVSSDYRVPRNK